jgi:hypothetical protein
MQTGFEGIDGAVYDLFKSRFCIFAFTEMMPAGNPNTRGASPLWENLSGNILLRCIFRYCKGLTLWRNLAILNNQDNQDGISIQHFILPSRPECNLFAVLCCQMLWQPMYTRNVYNTITAHLPEAGREPSRPTAFARFAEDRRRQQRNGRRADILRPLHYLHHAQHPVGVISSRSVLSA